MLRKISLWVAYMLLAALLPQADAATPLALLTNAAATGSALLWPGGAGEFEAVGTFGGCTVTFQFLMPDGTTWQAVGSTTTVTAATLVPFSLPKGQIRAAISGGTSVSVTVAAAQVFTLLQ